MTANSADVIKANCEALAHSGAAFLPLPMTEETAVVAACQE